MAIYYVDYENGNDANTGLSFAQRKKTLPSANTAASAGDTIRIMASPTPTSIGSATWTNLSKTVTVPSGLTSHISTCEVAWTAGLNVTTTTSATRKFGSFSTSIAIGAAFITGQVARESFSSTDYSGFQQVSFWIRTNLAIGSGVLELRLCSDALGLVTVNTIPIPAIPTVNLFTPVTVDLGSALGASIQSIALHAVSDPGTVTILLDNIIACKASSSADSITLNSLLGKNTAGETFWAIQSINGTTVLLDASSDTSATLGKGYYGTTETVTTYKLEPIKTDLTAATTIFTLTKSGSYGSPILFSGGWNRTDMSTQTSETWFSGSNSANECIRTAGFNFLSFEKLYNVRYSIGFQVNGSNNIQFTDCGANNCVTGITISSNTGMIDGFIANSCSTNPFLYNAYNWKLQNIQTDCSLGTGIQITNGGSTILENTYTRNCTVRGFLLSAAQELLIRNPEASNNGTEDLRNDSGMVTVINPLFSSATPINTSSTTFTKGVVRVQKFNGDPNDHRTYTDIGRIESATDANRHTASGYAWKFSPTSANATDNYPLALRDSIKIACVANNLVTVKVWVKRSNAAITARLMIPGGQLAGVPSNVYTDATGPVGIYEQITVTFTPTESGVLNAELQAFGSSVHNAWFDDMTITQT